MQTPSSVRSDSVKLAIIGMSCRFPGASGLAELWSLLSEGRSAFSPLESRWQETLVRGQRHEQKPPVPRAGLLDSIRGFDAAFFGISPREAERMDPQQRILLELAWEAFEDAGIPPEAWAGERAGVYVGFNTTDYWSLMMDSAHRERVDAWTGLGGSPCILSNRISYTFDLRGPSMSLDSACSASLLSLHLARQSLARGEVRTAIAGGVTLQVRPELTLGFARATMLSPTSQSRPFGDDVNGYVRGEGAGIVLLKRLEDAIEDGDRIHAVIAGSAVSQDGHSNGITVPTVSGQAEMLKLAYADAGIDPRNVRYVEAHGTGTPVGDPIEASALGRVIGRGRNSSDACVIGSIKSNIGHLEAAAGMAGLIKAVLCIEHDELVPSLGADPESGSIDFDQLGLRVAQKNERLRTPAHPFPVVGVSGFGFGGTNAHVVLEAAPEPARGVTLEMRDSVASGSTHYSVTSSKTPSSATEVSLLPLSARSEAAVRAQAGRLSEHLRAHPELSVRDVGYTLAAHRSAHAWRSAVVADDREALIEQLDRVADGSSSPVHAEPDSMGPVLVFSGMGPQWWGMGRELYANEPSFRACIQNIDQRFASLAGWSMIRSVFEAEESQVPVLVERADIGHPAHFALQLALFELLESFGVRASAIVGHSAGEVSAACASGILSFEDSLRVLHHRSRLVQELAGSGRMLAVEASVAEAEAWLARFPGRICVSAENAESSIALSGDVAVLEQLAAELDAQGRFARLIPGCFPYHSDAFEPIRERLIEALEPIEPRQPTIPIFSTVHGGLANARDYDARYWWRNVRERVQLAKALDSLVASGRTRFIELGAHPALLRSLRRAIERADVPGVAVATLHREQPERARLLTAIAELWNRGTAVELARIGAGNRVDLPTYAWQHEDYWIPEPSESSERSLDHPVRGERLASERPIWHARLSETHPRWARDHFINGETLLPAVAWVEAWLSAAHEEGNPLPLSLEDVRFDQLRTLGSEPVSLRIRMLGERCVLESSDAGCDASARWLTHGSARLVAHAITAPPVLDPKAECSAWLPMPFDYDALREAGYAYSGSFRCVEEAWMGPSRAWVRLRSVELEERDGDYLLHPALFDGALHAVLACTGRPEGSYLPVGFERITLLERHDPDALPTLFARAELRYHDSEKLLADILVCDETGKALLFAHGAEFRRAGRPRYQQQGWLHQESWCPAPPHVDPGFVQPRAKPEEVASNESLLQVISREHPEHAAADQQPIQDWLTELARQQIQAALASLLGERDEDLVEATAEAIREGRIDPRHRTWVTHLARELSRSRDELESNREKPEGGAEQLESGGYEPETGASDPAGSRARGLEAFRAEHPEWHLEASLIERFGERLIALLQGEASAHELLLPPHSELGRSFYTDSETVRPAQQALCSILRGELASRAGHELDASNSFSRPLRILEVGAGTGGATGWLLAALPAGQVEYVFTDISAAFFPLAEERFGRDHHFETRVFDASIDPVAQGFTAESFDVVLASTVLHATPELQRTLEHCRRLLRPDGLLLFSELVERPLWLDLVWGAFEGWWCFEDRELRTEHCLLPASSWCRLLTEVGFEGVCSHSAVSGGLFSILLARAPEAAQSAAQPPAAAQLFWTQLPEPARCLVVGVDPASARLAERLRSCGWIAETQPSLAGLDARLASEAFDHVVWWAPRGASEVEASDASADAGPEPRAGASASDPLASMVAGPVRLSLLARQLAGSDARLTIVTRGGQQIASHDQESDPFAAATWGFARVLANEHPELEVLLIDLQTEARAADAELVAGELFADCTRSIEARSQVTAEASPPAIPGGAPETRESEVALRGARRYVPRLVNPASGSPTSSSRDGSRRNGNRTGHSALDTDSDTSHHGQSFAVAFARAGDPSSVYLRPAERVEPGPGEIEVEVTTVALDAADRTRITRRLAAARASGAEPETGQLCDDPREVLEISGVVRRIGAGVEQFSSGDRVAGVSTTGLGRFVCAPAALFAALPDAISDTHACSLIGPLAIAELALESWSPDSARRVAIVGKPSPYSQATATLATRLRECTWGEALAADGEGPTPDGDRTAQQKASCVVCFDVEEQADLDRALGLLEPFGSFVSVSTEGPARGVDASAARCPVNTRTLTLRSIASLAPARVGQALTRGFARWRRGQITAPPHTCIPIDRLDEALRLASATTELGRVLVTGSTQARPALVTPPESLRIRPDATYLITGGLGGFGLAVARWLAESSPTGDPSDPGARYVALMGRSGATTDEAKQAVADLRRHGVQVRIFQGDVSIRADVDRVLAEIRAEMPPLRGIFHGAMVLEEAIVSRVTRGSLERVLSAKALGAWWLHHATRACGDRPALELDFFVLCSSISRALAIPGQGAYVAANEILRALAHARRAEGLCATCIDWGVIQDVGYVSRHQEVMQRFEASGLAPITARDALSSMGALLAHDPCELGIFACDWQHAERARTTDGRARFSRLRMSAESAESDDAASSSRSLCAELESAVDASEREALIVDRVRARAGVVLRRPPESIPADVALVELGFDSLMEVELRLALQRETGVEMQTLRSMRGGTVRAIARSILELLAPTTSSAGSGAPTSMATSSSFESFVDQREAELTSVFERGAEEEIRRELTSTLEQLETHVGHLDATAHAAHRAVFYPKLARFYLKSAMLRRAHDKPLGYAGDFELMKIIYQNRPAGAPLEAAVDAFALSIGTSQAVRYRTEYFRRVLEPLLAQPGRLRIANIGCGPAWETRELQALRPELAERLDLVLVDQDEGALAECQQVLVKQAQRHWSIDFVCAPVEELVNPASPAVSKIGQCDLVWSAGLFDYFNDQSFERYLQALYARVRPGGTLSVGNIAKESPARWMIEYVTDWFIHHRSLEEVQDQAEALSPEPDAIRVDRDPTGSHLFLTLSRPR